MYIFFILLFLSFSRNFRYTEKTGKNLKQGLVELVDLKTPRILKLNSYEFSDDFI